MGSPLKRNVYETDIHEIHEDGLGIFTVWNKSNTHLEKCGTFHFSNDPKKAILMAIDFVTKREQKKFCKIP